MPRWPMCSRAFRTVMPCGSTTAFFGVMMIFAFMRARKEFQVSGFKFQVLNFLKSFSFSSSSSSSPISENENEDDDEDEEDCSIEFFRALLHCSRMSVCLLYTSPSPRD